MSGSATGDWDSGVAVDPHRINFTVFPSCFAVRPIAHCPRPAGTTAVVDRLRLFSPQDNATLLSALTTRSDPDVPSVTWAGLPVAGLIPFQPLSQAGCRVR